jgi:hypothetical protein
MLTAAIELVGRSWTPAGDIALEMLQVHEVGGMRTPLTGPWSRWGWNHPGPLLFYVLAPFTWLAGNIGALAGVLLMNALASLGAVWLGWRRGGPVLAALVALIVIVLASTLSADLWISPWNPWVGLLPLFTVMLLAWSLAERDVTVLPWLVGVGSFIVQSHVGFAPVVFAAAFTGLLLSWRPLRANPRSEDPDLRRVLHRAMAVSALVAVVVWLPPVVEQFARDGNLRAIVAFVRDPPEAPVGWAAGWRAMLVELRVPGAWITGEEFDPVRPTPSPLPALSLLIVLATLGVLTARRGLMSAARLAALALVSVVAGVVASARVTGLPFDYLLRFWWAIGALVWLSIAWSAAMLLIASPRTRAVVQLLALAAAAILSVSLAWRVPSLDLPDEQSGVAVAAMGAQVERRLHSDATYVLEWADRRTWGGVGMGLVLYLRERGINVKVPREYDGWFDSWHLADRARATRVLTLIGDDDAADGAQPPASATRLARYDPLTDRQRDRTEALWASMQLELGPDTEFTVGDLDHERGRRALADAGIDQRAIDELAALRARGEAYTVYLTSTEDR